MVEKKGKEIGKIRKRFGVIREIGRKGGNRESNVFEVSADGTTTVVKKPVNFPRR